MGYFCKRLTFSVIQRATVFVGSSSGSVPGIREPDWLSGIGLVDTNVLPGAPVPGARPLTFFFAGGVPLLK